MNFTDLDLQMEKFVETLRSLQIGLERFSRNLDNANEALETAPPPDRETRANTAERIPTEEKKAPESREASSDPLSLDDTAVSADTAPAVDTDETPSATENPMSVTDFRNRVNEQFLRGGPGTVAAHTRPLLDKYAGEGQGMRAIAPERYASFIDELTALTDSLVGGDGGDS